MCITSRMGVYFTDTGMVAALRCNALRRLVELRCAVLSCAALRSAALCCALLCSAVLLCSVLFCIVLYCSVLFCIVLYCSVLFCVVLYGSALDCPAPHGTSDEDAHAYRAVASCTVPASNWRRRLPGGGQKGAASSLTIPNLTLTPIEISF